CNMLCNRNDTCLCNCIWCALCVSRYCRCRRDVYDHASSTFDHYRNGIMAEPESPFQVHLNDVVKLLFGNFVELLGPDLAVKRISSVIDQDVNAPMPLSNVADEFCHTSSVWYIKLLRIRSSFYHAGTS